MQECGVHIRVRVMRDLWVLCMLMMDCTLRVFHALKVACALIVFCTSMVCCTEVGVIRCPELEKGGYLSIYPDQSEYTLPALRYYFYNMDGQTACLTYPCDGEGNFEGRIPAGTYRVIAVNPEVENVKFTGMDRYETAMATTTKLAPGMEMNAVQVEGESRSSTVWSVNEWGRALVGPGDVYLVNLGDFEVPDSGVSRYEPVPQLLTRQVRVRFLLGENLLQQVSGIEGSLCGVYPSVKLFGGELCLDEIDGISASTIGFEAVYQQEWLAVVRVFGLCHPLYGEVYTSILDLTLSFVDGRKASAEVDLTGQLSDIIDRLEGVIPVTLSLELEIEADQAGITVGIMPWDPDGGDDIELF